MTVVDISSQKYRARRFALGRFRASGTLCGHVDLRGLGDGTYVLSPDEILELTSVLARARADVLANSDPLGDRRLYEPG